MPETWQDCAAWLRSWLAIVRSTSLRLEKITQGSACFTLACKRFLNLFLAKIGMVLLQAKEKEQVGDGSSAFSDLTRSIPRLFQEGPLDKAINAKYYCIQ